MLTLLLTGCFLPLSLIGGGGGVVNLTLKLRFAMPLSCADGVSGKIRVFCISYRVTLFIHKIFEKFLLCMIKYSPN